MRLGTEAADPRLLAGDGLLGTAEYCFYRTGESDGPPWHLSAGTPHLGHGPAVPSTLGSRGMVARLLSWMSRPHEALRVALAQPRERGGKRLAQRYRQRTPAMAAHENYPTMDGARSALIPIATGFRLRGIQARCGCSVMSRGVW